jgi:TolA-binding protein
MNCPDNLLTGHRKGGLGAEEQARLDAHLARCPSCRLSLRVGADFDDVLQTAAGDDLIAARFAKQLGPKFVKERTPPRGGALRYAWVAAASLAILASAGLAAASLGAWPFAKREPPAAITSPPHPKHSSHVPEPEPVPVPVPASEPEPEVASPVVEHTARAPNAAELFAQANAKRREGQPSRARSLYRELQQRYPRAPEVEVSHVSLGRVHLELGEGRAALEQFARYLTKQPRGPLAEEALFGKATALARLQRPQAECQTWEALLAAFPNSLYADRARHRLETLLAQSAHSDRNP